MAEQEIPVEGSQEPPVEGTPESIPTLDSILSDIQGFGLEQLNEAITIQAGGKSVRIKLSNISTQHNLDALLAVDGMKGQLWMDAIRAEILSYAITWINGMDVREHTMTIVVDPVTQAERPFRETLRDSILGWATETKQVLWKALMTHCQRIEDRLFDSLPEPLVMTEIEKQFLQQAMLEIQDAQQEVYKDTIKEIVEKSGTSSE